MKDAANASPLALEVHYETLNHPLSFVPDLFLDRVGAGARNTNGARGFNERFR
jgi:hypothetical protein